MTDMARDDAPSLSQDEAFARIRLLRSPHIGPVSYAQLLARHGDAAPSKLAPRRHRDPAPGDIGVEVEHEAAGSPPGDAGIDMADAIGHLPLRGKAPDEQRAIAQPATARGAAEGRVAFAQRALRLDIGAGDRDRSRATEAGVACAQVDIDALPATGTGKVLRRLLRDLETT